MGIRCCIRSPEERIQAYALFENSQPKLVVDIISLITLHCLEATDPILKAFGKLRIAQSTIDTLLQIIYEREAMWSEQEGMTVGKEGDRYVRYYDQP